MAMTEAEAREKWCPMARVTSMTHGSSGVNRGTAGRDDVRDTRCLASGCALWTWVGKEQGKERQGRCGLAR